MRNYDISYSCVTDDEMMHVSTFSGSVDKSTDIPKIVKLITDELTEDGQEIDSISIKFKFKNDEV